MYAVSATVQVVQAYLKGCEAQVSIAAVNAQEQVVLAGEGMVLDAIIQTLQQQGIRSKALVVSHAFHSPLMRLFGKRLLRFVSKFPIAAARCRLFPVKLAS